MHFTLHFALRIYRPNWQLFPIDAEKKHKLIRMCPLEYPDNGRGRIKPATSTWMRDDGTEGLLNAGIVFGKPIHLQMTAQI